MLIKCMPHGDSDFRKQFLINILDNSIRFIDLIIFKNINYI